MIQGSRMWRLSVGIVLVFSCNFTPTLTKALSLQLEPMSLSCPSPHRRCNEMLLRLATVFRGPRRRHQRHFCIRLMSVWSLNPRSCSVRCQRTLTIETLAPFQLRYLSWNPQLLVTPLTYRRSPMMVSDTCDSFRRRGQCRRWGRNQPMRQDSAWALSSGQLPDR